jgi:hypothetical protein
VATVKLKAPLTAIILDANSQTRFYGGVMKISRPRFRLILAGIILLVGGIVFEEKHRAATLNSHHIAAPELTYAVQREITDFPANNNFGADVNLWFNPGRQIHDDDGVAYARVLFQSELSELEAYERIKPSLGDKKINLPSMNMADKSVNYSLFTIGNFTANLKLTPVLPTPQAIIPTEIKPGLGGSFSF